MKILHVCNWCSGITTRNVNALKRYSRHSHELVTRIAHPYDLNYEAPTYTEAGTTKELVLGLAEEADALHFHAVGYAGSPGHPETIHKIDWSQFKGKKRFIIQGMCSYCIGGRTFTREIGGVDFLIPNFDDYDAVVGPILHVASLRESYVKRLQPVPDMIPINDWLYTPLPGLKPKIGASFKNPEILHKCSQNGIDMRHIPTPTKMPYQLAWRRKNCRFTLDNCTDGHLGLMGIESMSQGIPTAVYIHPINFESFAYLESPPPPYFELEYGGGNAVNVFSRLRDMPEDEWQALSRVCRQWIEDYYNEERLVKVWDEVYDKL